MRAWGRGVALPLLVFLLVALAAAVAYAADDTLSGGVGQESDQSHVVAKGETLYGISRSLGIPVAVLQRHNDISDPTSIKPGTRLTVPGTHTVAAGETLYAIGRRYRVTADAVLEANGITDPTTVAVGTMLILPSGATIATAAAAVSTTPAARSLEPSDAVDTGIRLWPVAGPRRTLSGKLNGVVIESSEGAPIVSVSSGVVRWASVSRGYGRVIFVQNPLGYIFGYLGIADLLVTVGDHVTLGTEIARLGRNPHDNAANLYFLVFKDGSPIDPVDAPRV